MNWMELFKEAVWLPVAYLFDPARRVFIGYLLMSGLIGLCLFLFCTWKIVGGKLEGIVCQT